MSSVTHLAWYRWAASLRRRSLGRVKGLVSLSWWRIFVGTPIGSRTRCGLPRPFYVLHCFQKKSPSGIRTAKTDIDLIHERLKTARNDYKVRYGKQD